MPVYLVKHTHSAEKCPTNNPEMVQQLASHMTVENADKYGVKLKADWVDETEHTAVFILEADSPDKVTNFTLPFLEVGSLMIKPGLTCELVAKEALGE